jgi:hypothetical protein
VSVKLPDWIEDDEVVSQLQFDHDGPVQKLPPWTGDDRAMLRWLGERLRAMRKAELIALAVENFTEQIQTNDGRFYPAMSKAKTLALAIDMADYGDIKPLRKLYPDIAEFINLPKRLRGKQFKKLRVNPILLAAQDAQRVRALWKRFFPGRRRGKHDKSAERFAAELYTGSENQDGEPVEITEGMVINRLKKKLPPSK